MEQKRKKLRLEGYDYCKPGYYFVTICVKNMQCIFGEIKNKRMVLNKFGIIAEKCWQEIPDHIKNVDLDAYIIMPNHIHGIIIISNEMSEKQCSLPTIVGSFKSAASRKIRKEHERFYWQKSYYDHIIRDEEALENIRNYILSNPSNWEKDTENPQTK